MNEFENNDMINEEPEEIIEKIDEQDVEEIPPTPIAPSAPEPNFTEAEGGFSDEESEKTESGFTDGESENVGRTAYIIDDEEDTMTANVLGIISLITGIFSILCCCISWLGIVFGVAGVVCGIISMKKSDCAKGLAVAGITCGIIGIAINLIGLLIAGFSAAVRNVFNKPIKNNGLFF